jgi:hypothetical protein
LEKRRAEAIKAYWDSVEEVQERYEQAQQRREKWPETSKLIVAGYSGPVTILLEKVCVCIRASYSRSLRGTWPGALSCLRLTIITIGAGPIALSPRPMARRSERNQLWVPRVHVECESPRFDLGPIGVGVVLKLRMFRRRFILTRSRKAWRRK